MGNCISRPRRRSTSYYSEQSSHKASSSIRKKNSSTHTSLVSTKTEGDSILPSLPTSPVYEEGDSSTDNKEDGTTCSQICDSESTNAQPGENKAYAAMLACNEKLVSAVATDYLNVAGILLQHGFISEQISAKMLLPSSTPHQKATILVTAIRERFTIAPQQFPQLMKLFSEQISTRDVAEILNLAYEGKITELCLCAVHI